MAHYADPRSVRHYAGLNEDDVPDGDLDFYIDEADRMVFRDVAIEVIDEDLSGNINGTNSTFDTCHRYIADTDYDCAVGSTEVTVYGWGKAGSLDTRVALTVSSINPTEGKIYLASAPSATYDVLTINYYYYKTKPKWNILKRAANFYAAYDFIFAEYLLIPIAQRRGALSWRHARPYRDLYQRYLDAINVFNSKIYSKKKQNYPTMDEKYMSEY